MGISSSSNRNRKMLKRNKQIKEEREREKEREKERERERKREREREKEKEKEKEDEKLSENKEDEIKDNNPNESLISFQNGPEPNDYIQNLEDSKLFKEDNSKKINEQDTNIFLAFNVLYGQYRNSNLFNLYFGNENIVEPIFIRKINNFALFFYHFVIKEEDILPNNIDDKKKITLIVDNFHTYYTTISYLNYHINFIYDLNWEKSKKNIDEGEMPGFDYSKIYIFYFMLNYLKVYEVSNILIGDILENLYQYLYRSENINFRDLLFLLLESYKINNEDLINNALELFNNKKITFDKKINNDFLISLEDLEKYFFNEKKEVNNKEEEKKEEEKKEEEKKEEKKEDEKKEEEKKEEVIDTSNKDNEKNNNNENNNNIDNNENKKQLILEKIRINIIIRLMVNKFDEYFKTIRIKEELVNYLFELVENENKNNNKYFLVREITDTLFEVIKSRGQLETLLKQCTDISLFMTLISKHFDLIKNINGDNHEIKVYDYINSHTLSLNNLYYNEFIQNLKNVLEKEKNINFPLFNFNELIQAFLQKINDIKNLQKCILLFNTINDFDNLIPSRIIYLIYDTIHNIFLFLAKRKLISNEEILDIISKKDRYYSNEKYNSVKNRPMEVFDNLLLKSESENFFDIFREKKIWNYFLIHKDNFISYFLEKIKDISYFYRIFWLFPKELFGTIYKNSASSLSEKFQELVETRKFENYNSDGIKKDFLDIMEILSISNNSCTNLLNVIEKTFRKKLISQLYLDLITQNNINLTEKSFKKIMNFLSHNLNENNTVNNETILFLLEKSGGKEDIVKAILDVISIYSLTKENFLSENDVTNYKIFKYLNNFFKRDLKWFKSSNYYCNTIKSIKDIEYLLFNLKITYSEFNYLFKTYGDQLLQNLVLLFLGNEEKANRIYKILDEEKKNIYNLQTKLNDLLNCYKYFYPISKKERMVEIADFQRMITTLTINELHGRTISKQLISLSEEGDKVSRLFNLYNSFFFMTLYREVKSKKNSNNSLEQNEEIIIKKTENEYNKLVILFNDNEKAKKLDSLDLFYEELRKAESRIDIVRREINYLKNYFNIHNYISKDLENYIIIYLSKEEIKKLFLGVLSFIKAFDLKKSNFANKIDEYMTEIDNRDISLKRSEEISDFIQTYLKVRYDYEKDEEPDIYSECIRLLSEREKCFKFALGKEESEIRNLNEFLGMDENPLLQNDDIQSFGKVTPFINAISNQCKINNYNDQIVYTFFSDQLHEDDYLLKSFKEYINKYGLLENLYNEYLNKPEVSKTKIFSIINDSIIEIENYFGDKFSINILCKYKGDGKDKEISISFDELNELRDRALISNPNSSLGGGNNKNDKSLNKIIEKEKEHLENSQVFLLLIGYIKKLRNYLEELNEKGYPERIKIIIETKNKKISSKYSNFKDDGKNQVNIDIEELINELEDLFKKQKIALYEICKINPLMRFFYGKQFFFLSKYIDYKLNIDSKEKEINICLYKEKILSLLIYLTNITHFNEDNSEIDKLRDDIKNNKMNKIDENLYKISKYLEMLFSTNNITIENILNSNFIKNDKYQGFYTIQVLDKSYEIEILNWYYRLTKNLPLSFTLLICNENTSDEELTSFIYRAFFCEYNVLFLIQNIESLSDNKRKKIINILRNEELMENLKSTLIITYKRQDSDIYKSMMKINGNKKFADFENNKLNNKIECKSLLKIIYVVHSNASGVGKSFFIKQKAKELKLNYIYFSFGGSFTKGNIIKRLNELKKNFLLSESGLLHLDLSETDNDELTRDIIFSLTILKKYGYNENIICFSKDIQIYIELPFGFSDFKKRFEILNAFKEHKLDIYNLPKLVDKKQGAFTMIIDSDIQIVAGILNLFDNNVIYNQTLDLYSDFLRDINSCENLIKKYFDIPNPNYYQIDSFIRIMSYQFKNFIESIYVSIDLLQQNNILNIRTFMIESLINITKSFIKGVFQKIISSQAEMQNYQNNIGNNIDSRREIALRALTTEQEMISFEKFKPSLIFFNEDKQSLSIITSCLPTEEEYKKLERLYNSQSYNNVVTHKLLDYRKMSSDEILLEIKKVLNINNASLEELRNYSNSYVFTSDNFIKLILILTRIRANIPVVMMGETGCGKTSLLRVLSKLQNKGELKMKIKNIHAGIEEEDIVEFINKIQEEFAEEIEVKIFYEEQNFEENEKKYKEIGQKYYNRFEYFEKFKSDLPKLWVFFDEINTCDCLGLLSEIMCHHTCRGKELRNDIVFFAACNPYRLITKQIEDVGLLNKKKHKKRNYVYSVNPLPHSLLNFVFDFGNLKKEDEYKYIISIVEKIFEKYNYINNYKDLINIASNCISLCQNFIRQYSDVSSVSLREIRRFDLLYHWFMEYFNIKKGVFIEIQEEKEKMKMKIPQYIEKFIKKKEETLCIDSINLSLYMCYYIRISNKNLRKDLSKQLDKYFKNGFLTIPKEESLYIADNVNLERGTAKNEALLENLFSLFVCISNQIPLFIVGKPGTSKSMSVQIMYNSMKGKNSSNLLFKKFKSLYLYPYQGSETSTSKGILNIFNKAREPIKRNKKKGNKMDFIPAVFFDEMGLAENSINNPLKVIHSQLEYDENEDKVSFIGISNWTLDSSKMNRGISLLIPQPDLDDLIDTAKKIAQSYDKNILERYDIFFEILSKTYYNYKEKIKNSQYEDFHGNRDFYHLIKIAAKKIVKYEESKRKKKILNEENDNYYENKIIEEICISSLERNFGGFDNSINIIKEIFYTFYKNKTVKKRYNVLECIKENLEDKESRYLLLVSKSSISNYLLNLIFNKMNIKYSFYLGSKFKDEHEGEDYSIKMLNKIQLQMESGGTLVLQNLEIIYPSLYDLFNQNFTKMGNKNYARIAFSSNKSYSLVDSSFKVIILVEKENILKEEPPFLNRFEKHEISFEYLLNEVQNSWAKYIHSLIKELVKNKNELILEKQIINFSLEEIQGLIYSFCKNQSKNNKIILDDVMKYVFNKLVPIFSQDIIAYMSVSGFKNNYPEIAQLIYKIYNKKKNNLKDFLINTNKRKNIIFTFSNPLDPIFIDKNLNTEKENENEEKIFSNKLGYINDSKTNKIFISSLKSEKNFERKIREFYHNKNQNLCLLKFNENELSQLSHINFLVDSSLKDFQLIEKNYNNMSKTEPKLDNKNISFYLIFHPKKKEENNNINESEIQFDEQVNDDQISINKNILIIVYLTRHFKSDVNIKSDENESPSMISLLSNCNQIFIDNLEGENIQFNDLIIQNKTENPILKNLNLNKIIQDKIFHIFSCFKYKLEYSYQYTTSKNYITNIVSAILNNTQNINDFLIKQIIQYLKGKTNIIKDFFYNKNNIIQRDGDFISCLLYSLEKDIINYLLQLIFYFEKNQILFTKLIKADIYNKYKEIQNYIEFLVNDFSYDKISKEIFAIDRIQANNVGIILLNLNIPNVRKYIEALIKYIKEEISDDYLNNDQNLIKLRYEQIKKLGEIIIDKNQENKEIENIKKSIYKGEKLKRKLEEKIINDFNKINLFRYISENNNSELVELLFEDYLIIFLYKYFRESNYLIYLKFIKILLFTKKIIDIPIDSRNNKKEGKNNNVNNSDIILKLNKKEKSDFNTVIHYITICEIYSEIIVELFSIVKLIKEYFSHFDCDNLINIIIQNKIKFNYSKKISEEKEKNDERFYIIIESLIIYIYDKIKDIIEFDESPFYEFLRELINIFEIIEQLYIYFSINSLNVYNIKILSQLLKDILSKPEIEKKQIYDILIQTISFFEKEKLLLEENTKSNNIKELVNILNNIINEIKIIFPNNTQIEIFFYEIQINKITNIAYLQEIISIIFKNDELIPKSEQFIKYFLPKEKIIPPFEEKEDNFMEIFSNKNTNLPNTRLFLLELNNKQSEIIDETILFYFDKILYHYFIKLHEEYYSKDQDIYDKFPYNYFNICVNQLQSIINDNKSTISDLTNIVKLYSISYIKNYLDHYIRIITDENLPKKVRFSSLVYLINQSTEKNKLIKIIQLYILKLVFFKNYRKYDFFIDYMNKNYNDKNLLFYKKYDLGQNHKEEQEYLILNLEIFHTYDTMIISFIEEKKLNFKLDNSNIIRLFKANNDNENSLDLLYSLIANNILNKYIGVEEYKFLEFNLFSNFLKIIEELLKDVIQINSIQKKLLYLVVKPELFMSKIQKKYGKINTRQFDIITYSLRFLLSIHKKINFYSSFFDDKGNIKEFIQTNYFPGTYQETDLFLRTLPDIEKHLAKGPISNGCYVCSCGYYYPIPPCGFPFSESSCVVCRKKIGGEKHILVKRKGHIRIYKNKEDLDSYGGYNGGRNRDYLAGAVMTLNDYKEKIISKRPPLDYKGIKKESQNEFKIDNPSTRCGSKLTYRLLHFILYSHLMFSNALNIINDNDINEYCVNNMNCMEILENDWSFIENCLKDKGISKIQIFFNYIFKDFVKIFNDIDNKMENVESRNTFEKKMANFIIQNTTKEKYKDYEEMYLQKNVKPIGDLIIKGIIQEILKPSEYSEKDFPFLKYFYIKNEINKDYIYEKLKSEKDFSIIYPLLETCLSPDYLNKAKLLENLQNINNFSNILLKKYSYEITREEAKNIKINEALTSSKMEELFNKYTSSWNNINQYATKYECRNEMKVLNIDRKSPLSEFLLDKGELYHGMYLAAAYDMFIEWQNSILDNIINLNSQNGLLKPYIHLLKRKIYVQEASQNDILSITRKDKTQLIEEIFFKYIYRNCFEKNKLGQLEVDYFNYDSFTFDFNKMEIELGKILLIGKKLFIKKEEDNNYLNFVTYRYEGFRNNKSSIIIEFNEKYKSRDLSQQEKDEILRYLGTKNIINIDNHKIRRMKELENIYFSLQTLLFYIFKENFELTKTINDIIIELPEFICISKELKDFFEKYNNLGVDSILKLFEYFETLCFGTIRKNLNEEYKKPIDQEIQNNIKSYISSSKNGLILISKNFSEALRKLISRYIAGKRSDNEIDETKELKFYIAQEDLWDNDPSRDEELQNALEKFFEEFPLLVGQCLALYDILNN